MGDEIDVEGKAGLEVNDGDANGINLYNVLSSMASSTPTDYHFSWRVRLGIYMDGDSNRGKAS
jgi:hypothetical protein